MHHILLQDAVIQAAATQAASKFSPDSLQAGRQEFLEKVTTTPPNELMMDLGKHAMDFGLKVLAALVIYAVGAWVIKLISRAVKKAMLRKKAESTLVSFVNSLVSILLWIILITLVISALGINTTSLAALLAAGGVAIGMALSGTMQNFAGGIMLLIFKPFRAGDYIDAQGHTGRVEEINITSTKIITPDNRVVILPNGSLSNGIINNLTTRPIRRIETAFSVSYGSDADKVREAVLDILKDVPGILDATTPGAADPAVLLRELKDSGVEFIVRVWAAGDDYWNVLFGMNERIYSELPGRGISFPFPQLDVHIQQS